MIVRALMVQQKVSEAQEAQLLEILKDTIAYLNQQKGFIKLYQLYDRASGQTMQMHVWENEADLQAYLESDFIQQEFARVRAVLAGKLAGTPSMYQFEVVGQS